MNYIALREAMRQARSTFEAERLAREAIEDAIHRGDQTLAWAVLSLFGDECYRRGGAAAPRASSAPTEVP